MGKNTLLLFRTKTYIHNEQICLASLSPEQILNFNVEAGNQVELKIQLISHSKCLPKSSKFHFTSLLRHQDFKWHLCFHILIPF